MTLKTLLKEPLLHFLLLGAIIFVVYEQVSDKRSEDVLFISTGQQDNLIQTFSRTWQRPPTPQEFSGLLNDYIREEIAYREGMRMGLDDDDVIIRRRMRQKLELLAEDVASLDAPTEAELRDFLDQHSDDYMIEPRFSLRQIFFSPDRRDDPGTDASKVLEKLAGSPLDPDWRELGDPIPLPPSIERLRLGEIGRLLGTVFSEQLEGIDTGQWVGPVESGFGYHLVFVEERIEGQKPELEQVRDAVQRDWFSERRRDAVDSMYQRLLLDYRIEIEMEEQADGVPPEAGNAGEQQATGQ